MWFPQSKSHKENYLCLSEGRVKGFSLIKQRNQGRRKTNLKRWILWMKEKGSWVFYDSEYSSSRKSLPMAETW